MNFDTCAKLPAATRTSLAIRGRLTLDSILMCNLDTQEGVSMIASRLIDNAANGGRRSLSILARDSIPPRFERTGGRERRGTTFRNVACVIVENEKSLRRIDRELIRNPEQSRRTRT